MRFTRGDRWQCGCGAWLFHFKRDSKAEYWKFTHGCCGVETQWSYRIISRGQLL